MYFFVQTPRLPHAGSAARRSHRFGASLCNADMFVPRAGLFPVPRASNVAASLCAFLIRCAKNSPILPTAIRLRRAPCACSVGFCRPVFVPSVYCGPRRIRSKNGSAKSRYQRRLMSVGKLALRPSANYLTPVRRPPYGCRKIAFTPIIIDRLRHFYYLQTLFSSLPFFSPFYPSFFALYRIQRAALP